MGATITSIITEHGAIYKDGGQSQKDIIAFLKQPSKTESYFTEYPTDDTIIHKASLEFSSVLQAFQKAFTTKGNATFKSREIPLQRFKIDFDIYPDDFQASWLGFLNKKGLKKDQVPISQYIQEHIILQSIEDFELNEVYGGELAAITPGTATNAGENFDGIRKQINDGITATLVNEQAIGAIPTDPIECVEYIEAFVEGIRSANKLIYDKTDFVFVNPTVYKRFLAGNRDRYNLHYAQMSDLEVVNLTSLRVKELPSMGSSDKVWATPEFNRLRYTKNKSQERLFDVQVADRQVKYLTDFWKGLGFPILELVFTNDQDKA